MLPARWAGIPRIGLLCFSWLVFRNYTWPHSFQGRATISATRKAGFGIVKTQIKHKWSRRIQVRAWTLCTVTWHMLWSCAALQGQFHSRALQSGQPGWRLRLSCGTGIQGFFCLRHLHFIYESRSESLP